MKKDWILVAGAVVFALLFGLAWQLFAPNGEQVTVTVDGAVVGSYALGEEQTVKLTHHELQIHNNTVAVIKSDCTGQDCVKTAPIQRGGQAIICLPYRLNVQITAGKTGPDTVTY